MSLLEANVCLDRDGRHLEATLEMDGGVTALFGPSGAGKTTLLDCLAGLVRPSAGWIRLAQEKLFDAERGVDVPPEQRRIGYVFQEARLFPHLTVHQNLRYGWRAAAARAPREHEIHELLELRPLLDRRPSSLSGGEARRVAIGRALLARPRLLLLDEPLAGLDDARKGSVLALLDRIRAELHVPMLFVSHALGEILQLTTDVAVLHQGRTLGQGPLHELLGTDEVFRLADELGIESLLPVEIVEIDPVAGLTRARVGTRDIALPPVDRPAGTRALVAVRPEDVILARQPVAGISAQNALRGTVTRVTPLSDRLLVTVDVGAPMRVEVSSRAAHELGVEEGAEVYCLVKAFSFRWRRFDPPPLAEASPPAEGSRLRS